MWLAGEPRHWQRRRAAGSNSLGLSANCSGRLAQGAEWQERSADGPRVGGTRGGGIDGRMGADQPRGLVRGGARCAGREGAEAKVAKPLVKRREITHRRGRAWDCWGVGEIGPGPVGGGSRLRCCSCRLNTAVSCRAALWLGPQTHCRRCPLVPSGNKPPEGGTPGCRGMGPAASSWWGWGPWACDGWEWVAEATAVAWAAGG